MKEQAMASILYFLHEGVDEAGFALHFLKEGVSDGGFTSPMIEKGKAFHSLLSQ